MFKIILVENGVGIIFEDFKVKKATYILDVFGELYDAEGKITDGNGNIVLCTIKEATEYVIEFCLFRDIEIKWSKAKYIESEPYGN